jgi:hypothetical protein
MIRDIRCTYMSNGVVDIRWKDGRIRLNAVIRKEEMELFKVAFDYYLYETPFHASGTDQVEVWFQESNFKQQLAGHLKMDVEDEVFTRVYEQIQRAILKISKEGVTEMTIEEELGLPPQRSDINVLLAARTGAGKSTIIKSCSAVPDDVNFPVVSSNRTTTFPTEFVLTHDQTYEVKILFQERSWVDQRVQEAISSAVLKYAEHVLLYHLEDAETCKYETVEAFLNADEQNLFLIKLILGRYKKDARTELEAEHNQYWSEFYDKIAALGDQFVESFAVESGTPELSLERIAEKVKWMMVVKRKTPISLNSDLVQEVVHDIYQRVQAILRMADIIAFESATDQQVEEQPNGVVVHNEGAEEILVGYCKKLPTVNPWELLRLFFSRDSSDTGRSVTPLIKRAKVTLPYHESLEKVGVTISLHDIVGFGHSNSDSDSSSLEGSTNLDYSQYDVLAVVERSDDAMNDVTRKILKNVLENARRRKSCSATAITIN